MGCRDEKTMTLLCSILTNYLCNLLNEVDSVLKVEAEVDELPLNAFLFVLLLFENEHVVVEELLQSFVRVVDAQLLELVQLSKK